MWFGSEALLLPDDAPGAGPFKLALLAPSAAGALVSLAVEARTMLRLSHGRSRPLITPIRAIGTITGLYLRG